MYVRNLLVDSCTHPRLCSSFLATNRARIKDRIEEEGMESLAEISEKFLDSFPEYVTYPERTRLVDADKVRALN